MPQGSKKGGKAFAALFLSIGFVLIVALVAAIALNAGKYELPAASSSSSAGEPSASEPEESMPWQEGETSSVPEKDLPSAEPDSLYAGIVIQERRSDPISAKQIYKQVVESVVGVNTTITNGDATGVSEGSGIVLTEDGLILTMCWIIPGIMRCPLCFTMGRNTAPRSLGLTNTAIWRFCVSTPQA